MSSGMWLHSTASGNPVTDSVHQPPLAKMASTPGFQDFRLCPEPENEACPGRYLGLSPTQIQPVGCSVVDAKKQDNSPSGGVGREGDAAETWTGRANRSFGATDGRSLFRLRLQVFCWWLKLASTQPSSHLTLYGLVGEPYFRRGDQLRYAKSGMHSAQSRIEAFPTIAAVGLSPSLAWRPLAVSS